jgi:hypothetical protein
MNHLSGSTRPADCSLGRAIRLPGPGLQAPTPRPGTYSAAWTGGNSVWSTETESKWLAEEEPGRWRWKIYLSPTAATVIREAHFRCARLRGRLSREFLYSYFG